jgi:hypothetical protein
MREEQLTPNKKDKLKDLSQGSNISIMVRIDHFFLFFNWLYNP